MTSLMVRYSYHDKCSLGNCENVLLLAKPGSIAPHTKFKAETHILRRRTPIFSGYRAKFYFWRTFLTGVATLPKGTERVMPGDNTNPEIELVTPVAMGKGRHALMVASTVRSWR
jgi:elongation factor Tu